MFYCYRKRYTLQQRRFATNAMSATVAKGLRWIGMPAFMGLTTLGAPLVAVALPFIMLPTLGVLYKRHTLPQNRQADLNAVTYIYFGSIFGIAAVLLGQGLLTYAITKPLFGNQAGVYITELLRNTVKDLTPEQIALRAQLASSWQHWVFLVAMTYGMAGGIEELLKYAPIAYLRRRRQHRPSADERAIPKEVYLQYAVAAALGFSTIGKYGVHPRGRQSRRGGMEARADDLRARGSWGAGALSHGCLACDQCCEHGGVSHDAEEFVADTWGADFVAWDV